MTHERLHTVCQDGTAIAISVRGWVRLEAQYACRTIQLEPMAALAGD